MIRQLNEIFSRNKIKKLTALAMSTALWFYVMGSQDPSMSGSYTVPVSVINSSRESRAILEEHPIKIKLSAPRSNFAEYSESDFRATVDVANLTEGEYDLPVEASYPKGFELQEVYPNQIHVKIEPYVEKQIEAEVIVNGEAVSDSVVKGIAKSLDNLTVIGAKSDVEKVQRVIGYVGLTTREEDDFELQVPMSAIDADGREVKNVRVVPSAITVTVDLETGIKKKSVPVNANITLPPGKEFSKITVEPAQIEIAGKEELLNTIESIQTVALTLPAVNDVFHSTLKLVIPEGVTVQIDKVTVTAELKK